MRKISVALFMGIATVVSAQDVDLSQVIVEAQMNNETAAKLVSVLNAYTPSDSSGLYRDVIDDYIGNYEKPVHIKWAEHRGFFIGAVGTYQLFESNSSWGGGLEGGYFSNHWGFDVRGTVSNGYPDKTSMNQAQFRQYDAKGRAYIFPDFLQFCNKHLFFGIYGEFSYKYCRDYQEDGGTYVDVAKDASGTTTTTTTVFNKLDNRASTMGGSIGFYGGYDIPYTPVRVHASVDYGYAQNLTFMRDMGHKRLQVEVGASITLRKTHTNHKAMQVLGISKADLPSLH